jgi:AcrR family transcriptional regulator
MEAGSDPPGKKYDREAKIQAILQGMARLIAAKDFTEINIRDIVKEAGVSIGTVYLYFPDGKEGIVREMITRGGARIAPAELITSGEIRSVKELLRQILDNYYEFHLQNKPFLMALERASINRPDLYADINSNIDVGLGSIVGILEENPLLEPLQRRFEASPEFQALMSRVLKVIDGIIHRDLFFSPIFDSKEDGIVFMLDLFAKVLDIDLGEGQAPVD